MIKFLKKYADMKALNKYGVKSSDLKTLAGALMNEGKLNERSGLVAKTKIGSFNIHVVLNMSKLFLRIEKSGRVWTATLDGWNSGDANKFLDRLDDKSVTALTKKLKDVDHPKYNSLNKHGKVTVMKLKLSQQTLGRESVNESNIGKLEKELEKIILKHVKDGQKMDKEEERKHFTAIKQTVKLFPFSKFRQLRGEGKLTEAHKYKKGDKLKVKRKGETLDIQIKKRGGKSGTVGGELYMAHVLSGSIKGTQIPVYEKDLFEGKLNERKLPKRFTVVTKFRVDGQVFNTGDYAKKKERMGKTMVLNMDNNEMLSIDWQDYVAAVNNKIIKENNINLDTDKLGIVENLTNKEMMDLRNKLKMKQDKPMLTWKSPKGGVDVMIVQSGMIKAIFPHKGDSNEAKIAMKILKVKSLKVVGEGKVNELNRTDLKLMQLALKGAKQARIGSSAEKAYVKSLANSFRINKDQKDYKDWTVDDFEEDAINYLHDKR